MTTLRITLDDETYAKLEARAAASSLPVEAAASAAVRAALEHSGESHELDAAAEEMLEKYGSVFHRLSQ